MQSENAFLLPLCALKSILNGVEICILPMLLPNVVVCNSQAFAISIQYCETVACYQIESLKATHGLFGASYLKENACCQ